MKTLSTAIYLAIRLPDWNSLESVRLAHSRLELSSIVFFALLAVAEAFAHRCSDEKRKRHIDTAGIVFFVIAVLSEMAAYPYGQRNDTLSEQVIGSLDKVSKRALDNASKAESDSGTAVAQASDALGKTKLATNKMEEASRNSVTAKLSASGALEIAHGARLEAESFEKDIVSAKAEAAKAEDDLADALKRAAEAQKEATDANVKLADRTLSDAQLVTIANTLNQFPGQEFEIVPYWDSKESAGIAQRINLALQMARWKFLPLTVWHGLMGAW
jgi:hypothetical protein